MKGSPQVHPRPMSWNPDEETLAFLRLVALQNAVEYAGKAVAGSVVGRIMGMRADLRPHGRVLAPAIATAVAEANAFVEEQGLEAAQDELASMAPELLEARPKAERRVGLPELEGAEDGKVVLRFAPNPNGPLSFGHARGLVINGAYAERYKGTLILRFDDTDTVVKPPMPEAYETIQKETEWLLGRPADRVVIASDRIDLYHQHATSMIEQGFGYVCTCTAEAFREFRLEQQACPCRELPNAEQVTRWKGMLEGAYRPGEAVVRVKTGMDQPNPALRDWPALRLQDTVSNPHPRPEVGSKHQVWPLLDFQSAIEDHLQGVTHIIRGKDLMDSTRKQTLLYEHFGWTYPQTMYWGRVKVHEWGGFSTSAMRKDIENGRYEGWNDPRLPTLSALARRGIQAEALRAFWLELAITQKDISVPLTSLFSHNTKAVDPSAPRLAFVRDPVRLPLKGGPNSARLVRYPDEPEKQPRLHDLTSGHVLVESDDAKKSSFRLKDLVDVDHEDGVLHAGSRERNDNRPIVHWTVDEAKEATLVVAEDDLLKEITGRLEPHEHPSGTVFQLERVGYAILLEDGRLLMTHE
ncbi:MAG TPA: glutamate--tRNA ligase [Candidatus Poseidoniales archaeon]|nr:MAG TPA: glutamate--tRNA ligase [Candidatus Poseidoniales archaeon]